ILGLILTVENLNSGPIRQVLATSGHVIENASSIFVHDSANQRCYPLQVIPEFKNNARDIIASKFQDTH
ncbi:hypothetical protein ACJ73_05250, partial [Blastomyces percursus]